MTTSTLGGISMYTVDPVNRLVYYYAHLDRYNDRLAAGQSIAKGDTLGFVGTTGNAPKNTPHLHFQVMRWPADGKYWNVPIQTYEHVSQFWKYNPETYMKQPPYSRDFQGIKS